MGVAHLDISKSNCQEKAKYDRQIARKTRELHTLLFADNQVIFAKTERDLERMVKVLEEELEGKRQ